MYEKRRCCPARLRQQQIEKALTQVVAVGPDLHIMAARVVGAGAQSLDHLAACQRHRAAR